MVFSSKIFDVKKQTRQRQLPKVIFRRRKLFQQKTKLFETFWSKNHFVEVNFHFENIFRRTTFSSNNCWNESSPTRILRFTFFVPINAFVWNTRKWFTYFERCWSGKCGGIQILNRCYNHRRFRNSFARSIDHSWTSINRCFWLRRFLKHLCTLVKNERHTKSGRCCGVLDNVTRKYEWDVAIIARISIASSVRHRTEFQRFIAPTGWNVDQIDFNVVSFDDKAGSICADYCVIRIRFHWIDQPVKKTMRTISKYEKY